jgi:simple sugar transport system ATP-binding protein
VTAFALELAGIEKRFGSVPALRQASLRVRTGTVHALLGENGAGKTTLMRVAFGLVRQDGGTVRAADAELPAGSPRAAIAAGLWMVQQHFALVPAMTVFENVALGSTPAAARAALSQLNEGGGLHVDADALVRDLPVAEQQRVELVRAMTRGARVLILDEPTASLAPSDAESLLAWIRLFREGGGSVVLVTHRVREALSIADDVTVMRQGQVTWTGPGSTASIGDIIDAMLGASIDATLDASGQGGLREARIAQAQLVTIADERGIVRLRSATFHVAAGEIVGVAGVEGSGFRELLLAAAGRLEPFSGSIDVPDDVAYVPEDRHRDALLLEASVVDNVALKGAGVRRGWLDRAALTSLAATVVRTNDVRVPDLRAPVSTLSGGNQQRLVVGRELAADPSLVVAVNPTRGLDPASAARVRARLGSARINGGAVLLYSAELDELVEIADRIYVTYAGSVREVRRDREAVGRAMLGVD